MSTQQPEPQDPGKDAGPTPARWPAPEGGKAGDTSWAQQGQAPRDQAPRAYYPPPSGAAPQAGAPHAAPGYPAGAYQPPASPYAGAGQVPQGYPAPGAYPPLPGAPSGYAQGGYGYGAGPGTPGGYDQPGYPLAPYPGAPYQRPATRGFSIAGMVVGIASVVLFLWALVVVPIAGLVFSILGLRREPAGKGMAIAGVILNGIAILIMLWAYTGLFAFDSVSEYHGGYGY